MIWCLALGLGSGLRFDVYILAFYVAPLKAINCDILSSCRVCILGVEDGR
jgi:hypothetical protein